MMKVGLVVNPIAGIGGPVGLKGSDGREILQRAKALGGKSLAGERTVQALRVLVRHRFQADWITYPGLMGEEACVRAGLSVRVVGTMDADATTASDTRTAARSFEEENADLILFAGGDGTARDMVAAVGTRLAVLGIPAGVKIHSAVYALTPRRAGESALAFLESQKQRTRLAEVMDLNEEAFRRGEVQTRLFGYLRVPIDQSNMQHVKASFRSEREELQGIGSEIISQMTREPGTLFILGPGSTTAIVMEMLGLEYSLLGVDVVRNQKLVQNDVNETQLLHLLDGSPAKIVVTAIGGQGHILGRGNQQISPAVVRKVGKENIVVIATTEKLVSLRGRPFIVDSGDAALNNSFRGYVRVVTGRGEYHMMKVE